MADHDKINMNNMLPWDNTCNIKEEECQGDNFIDDKVYISETTITIDNAELQGPSCHVRIKEYDETTNLDNIKTELTSFYVTEVQNNNVKGEGISDGDIKIEFDNELLCCEHCKAYYEDYCIECGMLVHILNRYALDNADSETRKDLPNDILQIQECLGQTGIYALKIIPAGVNFGPFTGLSTTDCPWDMKGETFCLDKNKSKCLNWMQYINPTRNISEQNLFVFQCEGNAYYQSTRQIQTGEELRVYFGGEYGNSSNKIVVVDFITTMKAIRKDIFVCTFCCLGFSSKLHLAKHKTICVKDAAGKFSIEEVTQCPFCNIYLDLSEYHENHLAYCCEKNVRYG